MPGLAEAPDITPGNPSAYPRLGPGWQIIWAAIPTDTWTARNDLVRDLATVCDLAERTILNLLSQAAAQHLLQRRYRVVDGHRVVQYRRHANAKLAN
jgi:hypothetical protein